MVRALSVLALGILIAAGSVGCCSSCAKSGRPGYWRNWGLPGKNPVGKACCRGCDLCTDVGGPCGGWAKTGAASPEGAYNGVETDVIYEDEMIPTTSVAPGSQSRVGVTMQPQSTGMVRSRPSQY